MRVVVISCWRYRDAWDGFFGLFKKFWPDCPYPVTLITDLDSLRDTANRSWTPDTAWIHLSKNGQSWCPALVDYLDSELIIADGQPKHAPALLMQEDFWMNAPVNQSLIDHALEQMKSSNAGMIRLYPCPGADEDYGDEHYGIVKKGMPYRISCQASIWNPDYLHRVASNVSKHSKGTPVDFELVGTPFSNTQRDEVLAFKRDSGPWPIQYLCSAIGAGLWSQDAKKLCDLHGIQVDWSLRGFQAA